MFSESSMHLQYIDSNLFHGNYKAICLATRDSLKLNLPENSVNKQVQFQSKLEKRV